jgi:hypothetical protein
MQTYNPTPEQDDDMAMPSAAWPDVRRGLFLGLLIMAAVYVLIGDAYRGGICVLGLLAVLLADYLHDRWCRDVEASRR